MSRYAKITDPEAPVNVSTTITQKTRSDLQTLAFAKEHSPVKSVLALLIQRYVETNAEFLKTLSSLREEPIAPEPEAVTVN